MKVRPIPRPLAVELWSTVPRRLLLDPNLSGHARLVGANIAGEAHPRAMATAIANRRLADVTGLSVRVVQRCLDELEAAGYLWRLPARNELALDALQWAGYRCPWEASGQARPERAIVLCWRLPRPRNLGRGDDAPVAGGDDGRVIPGRAGGPGEVP
jgi:hypothetical protein